MGLWSYDATPTDGGTRRSASIESLLPLFVDGQLQPVQLMFRDDPVWGYRAYLTLRSGGFDSPTGSKVSVSIDGEAAREVVASCPESKTPMLSLSAPRDLWYALRDANLLTIDFPVRAQGTQRATFDVSGLDRSTLDWDEQPSAQTA